MFETVLFLATVGFCTALPFERLLPWLSRYFREANHRVEQATSRSRLSKAPYVIAFIHGLNFLKGFLPLYIANTYFNEDYHLVTTAIVGLVFYTWSPFNGFKNSGHMGMMVWGMYIAMTPWNLLWFPLIWVFTMLTLNSIPVGLISAILVMFFVVWTTASSPLFVMVNFVIFAVGFFAMASTLFDHLEGKKMTLRRSFDLRP